MITDEAKCVKASVYAEYIRNLVSRKHVLEIEIANQRDELSLTGVALGDRISTSPNGDAIPNGVALLLDMLEQYDTDLREYVDELSAFQDAIASLEPTYQMTLYLRYVIMRDWSDIAKITHYSEARIYQLRRESLIALYPVMPEVWRSQMIPDAMPRRYA